jgi:hypothetical protein
MSNEVYVFAVTEVVQHEISVLAESEEEANELALDVMNSGDWIVESHTKHFDLIRKERNDYE